jgi:hypothetical protein
MPCLYFSLFNFLCISVLVLFCASFPLFFTLAVPSLSLLFSFLYLVIYVCILCNWQTIVHCRCSYAVCEQQV